MNLRIRAAGQADAREIGKCCFSLSSCSRSARAVVLGVVPVLLDPSQRAPELGQVRHAEAAAVLRLELGEAFLEEGWAS
jgi:hypothetical protein